MPDTSSTPRRPSAPLRLRAPAPGWAARADVVVIGSGVAGLTAALRCAASGAEVLIVTKALLDDGSTRWAQGGIAAALGEGDTPEQHLDDTLVAGAGLCDEDAVRTLVTEGPGAVRRLIGTGAEFDTGERGEILLTREGGHHRRRIAHAGGDATGAEISRALVAAVRAEGRIKTIEHALVLDLLTDAGGRTAGVTLHVMGEGQRDGVGAVRARAVVLATGGMGQVFSATTNPDVSTGDGVALALRSGAEVSDLEFVQFHPTVLFLGRGAEGQQPLVSEAVRGEGAHLVDADGRRFMVGQHELAELAPRDIVAKGIMRRMRETGADHMFLDARHFGAKMWEHRFPTILAACRSHGIDPVTEPVPVAPAAHYASGGVRTDLLGRTSVPGLYACGEVACTGVHGANRLASNSLLEGLVFAERIAADIAERFSLGGLPQREPGPVDRDAPGGRTGDPRPAPPGDPLPAGPGGNPATGSGGGVPADPPGSTLLDPGGGGVPLPDPSARYEIQRIMSRGAGVLRSAESLAGAAAALAAIGAAARQTPLGEGRAAGPCVESWETANLLLVARVLVAAAEEREETRGCHWREDRPERDDTVWRRHVLVRLAPDGRPVPAVTDGPSFARPAAVAGAAAVSAPGASGASGASGDENGRRAAANGPDPGAFRNGSDRSDGSDGSSGGGDPAAGTVLSGRPRPGVTSARPIPDTTATVPGPAVSATTTPRSPGTDRAPAAGTSPGARPGTGPVTGPEPGTAPGRPTSTGPAAPASATAAPASATTGPAPVSAAPAPVSAPAAPASGTAAGTAAAEAEESTPQNVQKEPVSVNTPDRPRAVELPLLQIGGPSATAEGAGGCGDSCGCGDAGPAGLSELECGLDPDLAALLADAGLDPVQIEDIAHLAIEEDLDHGVDVTSVATVPESAVSTGDFTAREAGTVAGLQIAEAVLSVVCTDEFEVERHVEDGDRVTAGQVLLSVRTRTRDLLTAERSALNLLCRLSGIATATRAWADALEGTKARVRDTRKTTVGLRALEKYAVRCGGGVNHRMSLSDAALVKDNHVIAAGGVAEAFKAVRAEFPDLPVEVEVDRLDQIPPVLAEGADLILLDNFTPELTREAVALVTGRALVESSGRLTLANARAYAETGVDYLAVGALTHSSPVLDIGLDLRP